MRLLLVMLLTGCASLPSVPVTPALATGGVIASVGGAGSDPMLAWVGGLCTIAGVIAWVVTRTFGLRAICVGIGMILLNHVLARYGHFIFLPAVVVTGAISLTYGFLTIRRMLRVRKESSSCWLRPSPRCSAASSSPSSSAASDSVPAGGSNDGPATSATEGDP